jgi:hypothetical protein
MQRLYQQARQQNVRDAIGVWRSLRRLNAFTFTSLPPLVPPFSSDTADNMLALPSELINTDTLVCCCLLVRIVRRRLSRG